MPRDEKNRCRDMFGNLPLPSYRFTLALQDTIPRNRPSLKWLPFSRKFSELDQQELIE